MTRPSSYGYDQLVAALNEVDVGAGDVVFSHVGLGMLGVCREGRTEDAAAQVLSRAFLDVLGPHGTWVVPTYSYSYCEGVVYDPETTIATIGPFPEFFRKLPGARRSLDPIFSVAVVGPRSGELVDDLPHDCFGRDSVYDRLRRLGATLCNVGVGFRYATFVHHVEQLVGVPYRFPKLFTGETKAGDKLSTETWLYNVRDLGDPAALADLGRLERAAVDRGLVRTARVGRGELTTIGFRELWDVCSENIARDPWFLARGEARSALR